MFISFVCTLAFLQPAVLSTLCTFFFRMIGANVAGRVPREHGLWMDGDGLWHCLWMAYGVGVGAGVLLEVGGHWLGHDLGGACNIVTREVLCALESSSHEFLILLMVWATQMPSTQFLPAEFGDQKICALGLTMRANEVATHLHTHTHINIVDAHMWHITQRQ